MPAGKPGTHARRVYDEAIVVDMHNDMISRVLDHEYDPDVRNPPGYARGQGHTDLPRLVESGLTATFLVAWVDASYCTREPDASHARALEAIGAIREFTGRHPDALIEATTAADVRRAKREGKVAIFVAVEGGHAIEGSLDKLRALYTRGARYLTLTWNNSVPWADSSIHPDPEGGGLTAFGRDVVLEMNRLGMLVDVSHVSDRTFADVLATSRMPVVASHSSARALADHPRNLTDDQLRALAAAGGVACVNFYSRFIDPTVRDAIAALDAELDDGAGDVSMDERARRTATLRQTPLSTLIDHIDHMARVAGIDHVGLGSDFDGIRALPRGIDDVTGLPLIAAALLQRGYAEADVAKILGGNVMRVLEQVFGA